MSDKQPEKVTLVYALAIEVDIAKFQDVENPKDDIVKYLERYFSRKFIEDRIMGYGFPGISATNITANHVHTTVIPNPKPEKPKDNVEQRGPWGLIILYGANVQRARDLGVPIFLNGDTGKVERYGEASHG